MRYFYEITILNQGSCYSGYGAVTHEIEAADIAEARMKALKWACDRGYCADDVQVKEVDDEEDRC